jgi:hypothetical protein
MIHSLQREHLIVEFFSVTKLRKIIKRTSTKTFATDSRYVIQLNKVGRWSFFRFFCDQYASVHVHKNTLLQAYTQQNSAYNANYRNGYTTKKCLVAPIQ